MNTGQPPPPDQQRIRDKCFHPAGDFQRFPPEATNRSVLERFRDIVRQSPEQIAVQTPSDQLTYQRLDQAADQVARAIFEHPCVSGAPVALLFHNGASFVVASLGVIKAARIQLSLESSFPTSRLQYVLKQSEAGLVVTDTANLALARSLGSLPIVNIDELDQTTRSAPDFLTANADDPVVIDYTSGSTGHPKGIVWTHAGLLQVTARHTDTSHICRHDRLLMFRASVRAYLSVLLNGGTFCPLDLAVEGPGEVVRFIQTAGITIYRAAVSTFRALLNVLDGNDRFPTLRLILLFGEPVFGKDVEAYRRYFSSSCLLGSSLGCNEMDDYAYFFVDYDTPIAADIVPGGYPADDIDVVLTSDVGQRVAEGEIGEICVRAGYTPAGYWRNDEASQAAFVRLEELPAVAYRTGDMGRRINGCLFHLGRKDFQIKIRGFRVDVGSVEGALLAIGGVKQAVVTDTKESDGGNRLAAYIVTQPGHTLAIETLRETLGCDLPAHAIPSVFVLVDSLPMTATGKIDRLRLPVPDRAQLVGTSYVEPRTEMEKILAAIWREVLGLTQVGAFDNFLELGGDSLRATQVIARVMERFQVRPQIRALLDAATVAEMASVIGQATPADMDDAEIESLLNQLDDLSEEEARALLEENPALLQRGEAL